MSVQAFCSPSLSVNLEGESVESAPLTQMLCASWSYMCISCPLDPCWGPLVLCPSLPPAAWPTSLGYRVWPASASKVQTTKLRLGDWQYEGCTKQRNKKNAIPTGWNLTFLAAKAELNDATPKYREASSLWSTL